MQKIKTYQIALGPAIGWTQEGLDSMTRKNVTAVQTVYNIIEQTPGNELINAGIIVCIAAGNDYMNVENPGATDYNNLLDCTTITEEDVCDNYNHCYWYFNTYFLSENKVISIDSPLLVLIVMVL